MSTPFRFTCPYCRGKRVVSGFPCPQCGDEELLLKELDALVYNLYDPPSKGLMVRTFDSGATRDDSDDKLDYEGFLSPLALEAYARYMHKHRTQSDGQLRASDNWQKGIPQDQYMKSAWRHFMDVWFYHRNDSPDTVEPMRESCCALLFNIMGLVHELTKEIRGRPYSGLRDTELMTEYTATPNPVFKMLDPAPEDYIRQEEESQ